MLKAGKFMLNFKMSFLFVFEVADNSDVFPHKAYFDDDGYELSTQRWQWQRYSGSLFNIQSRLQEMRKLSGTSCLGFTWSFMAQLVKNFRIAPKFFDPILICLFFPKLVL